MTALSEREELDEQVSESQPQAGSLRDRIARRKRELEQQPEHTIILPVPRFEDILSVQYRPLEYREMFRIETRHEKRPDGAERLLFVAADKLVNACERLVEPAGADTYKDTGHRWSVEAARDLFDIDLPEKTTARQALIAIFDDEELLIRHASDYEEQRRAIHPRLEEKLTGESEASSAGI